MVTQTSMQQRPKVNTLKQHAQQTAKQILQEPFEILKNAGKQVSGQETEQETIKQNTQQVNSNNQQIEARKKKEAIQNQSHMQAFQQELSEIRQLQEQRKRDIIELRMKEEQEKKQKQEQEKQQNPLIEPIAKVKRGVLGAAGAALGVKRKQRSAELAKTPSN